MLTVKKKNSTFYSILSLHILNKNVYYMLLHDTNKLIEKHLLMPMQIYTIL